jgi:hypothetical protein
VKDEGE